MTLLVLIVCGGTAAAESVAYTWEDRLRGDAIVLLGEVHDNVEQHRLRLEILKRAFAVGWRPVIAMEQFDREHQADIEQARKERPRDADHLIEKATAGKRGSAWDWNSYRPFVALALRYDVPLLAANLSRRDAQKVIAQGYSAVFDEQTIKTLDLDHAPDAVIAAQEQAIDHGHCNMLPKDQLPAMAHAQLARDAVMAMTLRGHAANGIVLLAGNGHVNKNLGVPIWIDAPKRERVIAVGFIERGDDSSIDDFDAVVTTPSMPRADPCAPLRRK